MTIRFRVLLIALLSLTISLACALTVNATIVHSGYCGSKDSNVQYTIDDKYTLTISGTGPMRNYLQYYSFFRDYYIKKIIIEEGVTTIGNCAFYYCSYVTDVSIPDSVTYIGEDAFRHCISLEDIEIPSAVKKIGDGAFYECSSLTSVNIQNGVTSIGNHAFCRCDSLTGISIPNSVTSIGDDAFWDCDNLTNISIPNGVTSIGENAFAYCGNLTSISIPNSVTSIGDAAFCECSSLTSVNIQNGVTSIGNYAFCGCGSLTSVNIPNSVTSIGDGAFYNCDNLTSISIPNSVTSIGNYAFCGCGSLTSVNIPNSVTSISDYAFAYCGNLTSISIPNSVTSIGDSAFYLCNSLTSISIPNSVTSIGVDTFALCSNFLTIYGYKNSYAEKYAQRFGFPFKDIAEWIEPTDPIAPVVHGEGEETSYWDTLFSNPQQYNKGLSKFCVELCTLNDSDDWSLIKNKLDSEGYKNHEYNHGGSFESCSVTLASKPIYVEGKTQNLLLIICRGTHNLFEAIGDLDRLLKKDFWGFKAQKNVYDYYQEINNCLIDYINNVDTSLRNGDLKIIVTGHSLGGAAANLEAANLINLAGNSSHSYWTNSLTGKDDIYCYTFGAIDSLNKSSTDEYHKNEAHGSYYGQIHNVYNLYDSFYNGVYNGHKSGTAFATQSTTVYKFGRMDTFAHKFSDYDNSDWSDHIISNYKKAIEADLYNTMTLYEATAIVACPVDVQVYDGDVLVGQTIYNQVDTDSTTMELLSIDDVKFLILEKGKNYSIKLIAFDEGTMDIQLEGLLEDNSALVKYISVPLDADKEMELQLITELGSDTETEIINIEDTKLNILDDYGEIVEEISQTDTTVHNYTRWTFTSNSFDDYELFLERECLDCHDIEQKTVTVNNANLVQKIEDAMVLLSAVSISKNGQDVALGYYWTTSSIYNSFEKAVQSAKKSLESAKKASDIEKALSAFDKAEQKFLSQISVGSTVAFSKLQYDFDLEEGVTVGVKCKYKLEAIRDNDEKEAITYITSNAKVATVKDGTVSGVTEGNCYIIAQTARCTEYIPITVVQPVSTFKADQSKVSVASDEETVVSFTKAAKDQTNGSKWNVQFADEALPAGIANVDLQTDSTVDTVSFKIKAAEVEKATTAKLNFVDTVSGKKVSVSVSIGLPADQVTTSMKSTSLGLVVGKSTTLKATAARSDKQKPIATTVTWESDDESVATVDAKGKVTAKAKGEATITARATAGARATPCVFTVRVVDAMIPGVQAMFNDVKTTKVSYGIGGEAIELEPQATKVVSNAEVNYIATETLAKNQSDGYLDIKRIDASTGNELANNEETENPVIFRFAPSSFAEEQFGSTGKNIAAKVVITDTISGKSTTVTINIGKAANTVVNGMKDKQKNEQTDFYLEGGKKLTLKATAGIKEDTKAKPIDTAVVWEVKDKDGNAADPDKIKVDAKGNVTTTKLEGGMASETYTVVAKPLAGAKDSEELEYTLTVVRKLVPGIQAKLGTSAVTKANLQENGALEFTLAPSKAGYDDEYVMYEAQETVAKDKARMLEVTGEGGVFTVKATDAAKSSTKAVTAKLVFTEKVSGKSVTVTITITIK